MRLLNFAAPKFAINLNKNGNNFRCSKFYNSFSIIKDFASYRFHTMMLSMVLMVGILFIRNSYQEEIDFLKKCSIRYNMKKFLGDTKCEDVYKNNRVCNKTLIVSYSPLPPYIYTNETGQVDGILPGTIPITL